ncbi:outer membrane beta-barrel protein [Helicobacter bizzozeronii]|uniref:outer membrane beta-barrel protein n=1 Tax=Helicobacter bizzozeronii TaxID=56877 RepID=UPI0038994B58
MGIDALYNFYKNNNRTYGVFTGVMVGGSSWLMENSRLVDLDYYTNNNNAYINLNEAYSNQASIDSTQLEKRLDKERVKTQKRRESVCENSRYRKKDNSKRKNKENDDTETKTNYKNPSL